jgi:hypothetical protein
MVKNNQLRVEGEELKMQESLRDIIKLLTLNS